MKATDRQTKDQLEKTAVKTEAGGGVMMQVVNRWF